MRRIEPPRRRGPFEPRWPRRLRVGRHRPRSTPSAQAPGHPQPAGDEARRRLLDGCQRSIDALRAHEDAGAQELTTRLETLKAKLWRELRKADATGGDAE